MQSGISAILEWPLTFSITLLYYAKHEVHIKKQDARRKDTYRVYFLACPSISAFTVLLWTEMQGRKKTQKHVRSM